jgi:hypothetical protein
VTLSFLREIDFLRMDYAQMWIMVLVSTVIAKRITWDFKSLESEIKRSFWLINTTPVAGSPLFREFKNCLDTVLGDCYFMLGDCPITFKQIEERILRRFRDMYNRHHPMISALL